jgi:hypothetical protein
MTELLGRVPSGVWAGLTGVSLLLTIATWSATRRRLRALGEIYTNPVLRPPYQRAGNSALTVAAMIPATLFWGMVLAGSLHGLVAFGRTVLGWHNGWEYLVPGSLDGVSVTFAFLAFRAVRRQKAPDRCQRVVWGAALASATVNFAYEYGHSGHNVVAGGYLGLLSLFGMVMFHEFLDQFEEGAAYIKRQNPKFGLRWITWPSNTFCAAVAWRNYPPVEGAAATVLAAVANLERVRAVKASGRETRIAARHEQHLAREHRRAELAAAKTSPSRGEPGSSVELGTPAGRAPETRSAPAALSATATFGGEGARVPATAAAVTQWIGTWIRMCADSGTALGPLTDDLARSQYNLSARQLRNIRHAATSGALRRRAEELGVDLPSGYADSPAGVRVNGYERVVRQ